MAKGDIPNPWTYDSGIDANGLSIRISIPWNSSTRALQTPGTVHRDPGCLYTHIYIGLGVDGTPNSTTRVFNLTGLSGDVTFTAAQMHTRGLDTVDDILNAGNITAGP